MSNSSGVAVYCASSLGRAPAYTESALSVGRALANSGRALVYGGGSKGLMGVVSGSALLAGGRVVGVRPFQMMGKEGDKAPPGAQSEEVLKALNVDRSKSETVIVDSMHERKVEMAKRVGGFIGLPGGFGTFEEVFEVTTWTQIAIHDKPVVLLNVLSFYEPLRQQIQNAVDAGFINPKSMSLITFVDGPSDHEAHERFDWGNAALSAIDSWQHGQHAGIFDWTKKRNGAGESALDST